jgi:polysaccharide biosynthesis protein VpsJ
MTVTRAQTDSLGRRVADVAREVERWGERHSWTGSDPYDGGNSALVGGVFRHSARGRQIVAQVVKRSPVDLRRLLRVPPGLSSVTIANVASAHALGGFLDEDLHVARIKAAVATLKALRLETHPEPAWGYHWDAQSRVLYYPRTEPNGIATAFAGHALLDAHERLSDAESLDLGLAAANWFLRRVPRTRARGGAYFGYLAGDATPIHNANLLACSLLARAAAITGNADWASAAEEGVAYSLAHQREDGAWRYGETPSTRWIDGFHTGYVLDALEVCERQGLGGKVGAARRRGLEFYRRQLFLPDGTPKYYEHRVYPIDAQSVAQAIQTFAIAADTDPPQLQQARLVFEYAMRRMWRGDGRFLFQRRRLWTNPGPHMRWVQSPMLRALARLHLTEERA